VEQAELRRLVERARVARLATLGVDGRLGLVPICFAHVPASDELVSAVDAKPKRTRRLQRLANVAANPEVTVLVDHYDEDWQRLWWVRLRGRARTLCDGPEADAACELLAAKYLQYAASRPAGPVLAVALEEWLGWRAAGG
jgi:PPOX class probable F420-dependent enzyme